MPHRSFDTAETKIIGTLLEPSAGKPDRFLVAFLGEIIDDASAWISKFHHLSHFVEGLAGGVVASSTKITVLSHVLDIVEQRMSAGREQRNVRKRDLMFQMNC